MSDGAAVSNEPVVAAIPTPISVEPRVTPTESAEVSRQADEAKVAQERAAKEPAKKEAPAGDEKAKPLSIKESLAKARAKLDAEPATPIKVAAKEAMPAPAAVKDAPVAKDTKAAEPVVAAKDAKAAAEPAKADAAAVTRDEATGKFVSTKAPDSVVVEAPKPSHTAEPPPARMSAKAKEEWATLPEESRNEVLRMGKEFQAGFEKYKTAAERDNSLQEYHDMAAKGGTDVKTALSKYVGMEQLIRKDPIAGLHEIAKNAGLNLRDVAAKILNQPADQVASQADKRVAALENEIAELKKGLGSIHQERQTAQTNNTTEAVTKFASENPRFEELSDDIAFFLKSGKTKDLAEAYKLAELIKPASAAKVEATAPAAAASTAAAPALTLVPPTDQAAQTRGQKSIAGTPTAGSDPVTRQPSSSIKEAIRKAKAAAG